MKEKNSGVTLIALIITIIVLLILAGVTIAMIVGDNGILNQAANAKIQTEQASIIEAIELAYSDFEIEMKTMNLEQGDSSKLASLSNVKMERYAIEVLDPTFWNYLVYEKECMNEDGVINVESLVGTELSTGKGDATDKKDVYILEEIENQYVLKYYDNNSSSKELWRVSNEATKKVLVYDVDGESVAFEIEFEDGMTWGEWIESEYNTLEIYVDYIIRYQGTYYICTLNSSVELEDEIDENEEYILMVVPK